MENTAVPTVGILFGDKKLKYYHEHWKSKLEDLSHLARFVVMDPNGDLEKTGPVDVVLQKLCEGIGQDTMDLRVANLEGYLDRHPELRPRVIDPISDIEPVLLRSTMYAALARMGRVVDEATGVVFSPLEYETIPSPAAGRDPGVGLPVIVKTEAAAGHKVTHTMSVAFTLPAYHRVLEAMWAGLGAAGQPGGVVVQRYHNHFRTMIKVFVIGSHVQIAHRLSLPDAPPTCGEGDAAAYHTFNCHDGIPERWSCDPSPAPTGPARPQPHPYVDRVTVEVVARYVRLLRERIPLSLFGLDLIVDSTTGEVTTVDVNFFPSYGEMTDFTSRLAALCVERAQSLA